jgi:hypothetical protein
MAIGWLVLGVAYVVFGVFGLTGVIDVPLGGAWLLLGLFFILVAASSRRRSRQDRLRVGTWRR